MLQSQAPVAILSSKTGRTSDFPQSYFCPTNYLFAGTIITYKFTPKELAIENILHPNIHIEYHVRKKYTVLMQYHDIGKCVGVFIFKTERYVKN